MNRSKLLLCILLLCFAASLVYAVLRTPRQKTVDRLTYPPRQAASVTPLTATSSSRHTTSQPAQQPATGDATVKRDLFAPLYPQAVPGAANKRGPQQTAAVPPPPPPPPPTPQEIARQQLRSFRFIGTLTRHNLQVAFVSRGSEVQVVRVGDSLYPGYRVQAITPDAITMQAVDGSDSITLQLN